MFDLHVLDTPQNRDRNNQPHGHAAASPEVFDRTVEPITSALPLGGDRQIAAHNQKTACARQRPQTSEVFRNFGGLCRSTLSPCHYAKYVPIKKTASIFAGRTDGAMKDQEHTQRKYPEQREQGLVPPEPDLG